MITSHGNHLATYLLTHLRTRPHCRLLLVLLVRLSDRRRRPLVRRRGHLLLTSGAVLIRVHLRCGVVAALAGG